MNSLSFDDEESKAGDGPSGNFLGQLPVILGERKWIIIVPAILGLLAAIATIFFLPTKYESGAILLVQAPSLPTEIVGGSEQAVSQRIEAIRQQIINRPALIELIQKNDLYAERRRTEPLSGIVEEMRDAITMSPQTVDLGGQSSDQTISVRLAYTYENPAKVQAVTQQLMEQVVEVDSTTNAEQLTETVQFLTDQQQEIQRQVVEAQGELAAFNTRNGVVLSSASLATLGGGAAAYDMQISMLQREIADLEMQKRMLQTADTRDPAIVQAESALAAVRAAYTENHPDVVLAKQRLEQARAIAKQNVARIPGGELDTRLAAARSQIGVLQVAKSREASQTSAVLAQRATSPVVAQQAAQMQQRVAALNKQYEDLSNRLLSARASQRAGEEQMGERLLVVDPPVIPDTPTSPNRPLILAIGAAGGLLLGLVLAFAWELFLRPIRDPSVLAGITGARPLALVPAVGKPYRGDSNGRFSRLNPFAPSRKPKRSRRVKKTSGLRETDEYSSA